MSLKLHLNSRTKASLRKPQEECSFSIDINYETQLDDRCLAYYYLPDFQLSYNLDLKGGYSHFQRKDESIDQHLDPMLKAIMHHEQKTNKKIKADIISFRGVMTKILTLPYEQSDDIDLNLVYFDGQIFMEEDHALSSSKKRAMDEKADMMCYWGYKFETLATIPDPWAHTSRDEIMGRHKKKVNNIEQYCSVVRSGVGKVKTVLAGEVDCCYDYKPEHGDVLPHYLELKTSQVIRDDRDARKFERKLFKTWAQSFLLGLRKVVYGFRDEDGVVKSVEEFKVEQLPTIVKQSKFTDDPKRKWNGNEAISFYGAALEWIKDVVTEGGEGVSWRLQYRKNSPHLELLKIEGEEGDKIQGFILKEFKEWRIKRLAEKEAAKEQQEE